MGVNSLLTLANARAGMLGAAGHIADSFSNATRQRNLVVVTTAADSEVFTITINGAAITYTSDASGTKAEISAGLVAAINAHAQAAYVTAIDLVESLEIESDIIGTAYTITVTNPATGVLTLSTLTTNTTTIGFGLWVVRDQSPTPGVNAHLATVTGEISTGGRVAGLTLIDNAQEAAAVAANNVGYPIKEAMNVLRQGYAHVLVEDQANVRPGMAVFARHAAGAGETLGASRTDADGSDATAVPSARFEAMPNSSGVCLISYNIQT